MQQFCSTVSPGPVQPIGLLCGQRTDRRAAQAVSEKAINEDVRIMKQVLYG